MIVGTGVDIVEVSRVAEAIERHGERIERRVFTDEEIAYCRGRGARMAECYAARFAAKEAFTKALGTGVAGGISWNEIGVTRASSGKPALTLTGVAAERAEGLLVHLSLSHTASAAIAMVVIERIE